MVLSEVTHFLVPVAFFVLGVLKELNCYEGSCANLGHPQRPAIGDLQ